MPDCYIVKLVLRAYGILQLHRPAITFAGKERHGVVITNSFKMSADYVDEVRNAYAV